ncbi:MAG TPA: VanZ family protein [Brumimicrobium sp.]|nr:VanZ family protein [Brumimicrobium sp.]
MLRFILPSVLWTILVVVVSIAPSSSVELSEIKIAHLDKIAHFILYTLLSFFWTVGLKRQNINLRLRSRAYVVVVLGGFVLGLVLEIIQHFFTLSRSFEVLDLIANGIGCIFGVIIFKIVYRGYSKA